MVGKGSRPKFLHNLQGGGQLTAGVIEMEDWYTQPGRPSKKQSKEERPIPTVYAVIDNDLARDNIENDIPAADLEDL